jgi:hypothetical protein
MDYQVDVISRIIMSRHYYGLDNKTYCYVGTNEIGLSSIKEYWEKMLKIIEKCAILVYLVGIILILCV